MGWSTLFGIAVVHHGKAIFLPNHELHLREKHSKFWPCRVAVIGDVLKTLLRETIPKLGRPAGRWLLVLKGRKESKILHYVEVLPVWHSVPGMVN